jgi:hypothetical protein
MIVLDQERLSDFFRMVSSGFGATPRDLIIVASAIAGFVLLLVVFALVQRARGRRRLRRIGSQRYGELKERLRLTPAEEELIKQLARFLKEPQKRHLLLVSQPTFNYCAQKLKDRRGTLPEELSELRLKLGFTSQSPEAAPGTTAEIAVGTAVLIRDRARGRDRSARGRVVRQEAHGLEVRLSGGDASFRPGDSVGVLFQTRAGVFSFSSRIQSREQDLLHLTHAQELRRIQRRRFYRRRLALPVGVRKAGTEEALAASGFVELGGDGASLTNPGSRFAVGDTVELVFQAGGERFALVAEILRVSREGRRLHVRFAPMREATRDRIIGSLFRKN